MQFCQKPTNLCIIYIGAFKTHIWAAIINITAFSRLQLRVIVKPPLIFTSFQFGQPTFPLMYQKFESTTTSLMSGTCGIKIMQYISSSSLLYFLMQVAHSAPQHHRIFQNHHVFLLKFFAQLRPLFSKVVQKVIRLKKSSNYCSFSRYCGKISQNPGLTWEKAVWHTQSGHQVPTRKYRPLSSGNL